MSAPLTKEKLAELVKCVLCMKTFTSPQTMKCLHTFCKHCLENHAKRSSVDDVQGLECPRCKHFTAQSDVTACTRTEHLLTLYERGTKRRMCFQCETESAEWKCQDCDKFYCAACKRDHDKVKVLQGHVWLDIADSEANFVLKKTVQCATHSGKETDCFCFNCDVLLCSLCLLEGHDGHKRDTVHNVVDHVKSKVDEKLAAVKQIGNERFLRAEKLKDTRLLIQTYAGKSLDAITSRYEFLKRKLDVDYELLTDELKTSVDAEVEKVNAAISAEEAKQSHAIAVTSYVENTLTTMAGASMILETIEKLIPTINQFSAQQDIEPLMTSNIHLFKKTTSSDNDENVIGEIQIVPTDLHSRYQPIVSKEALESATVNQVIDMDLKTESRAYRMNIGFGKIVVCLWDVRTVIIYKTDGTKFTEVVLGEQMIQPVSATLVNDDDIVVASLGGLSVVNATTSQVISTVKHEKCREYYDVFYNRNTNEIYALSAKGCIDIVQKQHTDDWAIVRSVQLDLNGSRVNRSATMTITPSAIFFCNCSNEILQFSMAGDLLRSVTVSEHESANEDRFICAADADGRALLSVGDQLVLQHSDQSQVVKLDGVTAVFDVGFEDQNIFWVFMWSGKEYKLVKLLL